MWSYMAYGLEQRTRDRGFESEMGGSSKRDHQTTTCEVSSSGSHRVIPFV
uniref:Uncharacterized protein n=1 Tax=Octopus bimaculoides TaxID=37653 RepID=A0A0L8GXY7_OCTBM